MAPIPVTLVTGFLGSGKTTLILNLIPQLPSDYRLALLKNEFGDVAVDSQLATSAAISGVRELLNGCICCNLVGQLGEALETLRKDVAPDRIVIETSGSAFPATLALEVNRIAKETGNFVLDGVVAVIDVENWEGYQDISPTAALQARYTDLIVLNKWEVAAEGKVDTVLDRIGDLELGFEMPCERSDRGWVTKDVIFGLDAKLAGEDALITKNNSDHQRDHQNEVEVLSITLLSSDPQVGVDMAKLERLLQEPSREGVYRIKAVFYSKTPGGVDADFSASAQSSGNLQKYFLNWAFGRWAIVPANSNQTKTRSDPGYVEPVEEPALRMTIVTGRFESMAWKIRIETGDYICVENGGKAGSLKVQRLS